MHSFLILEIHIIISGRLSSTLFLPFFHNHKWWTESVSLCTLSAILQRKNASWDSKSVHHFLSGKISWWILSEYFLENKFSISFFSTLSSTEGLLVSLQISEARKIPPRCVMSMMTPVYFPQFAQTTCKRSIILLSSAVQMETTLSIMHHLHSTTCHAERLLSPPCSPHLRSFKGCRGCIQTAGYTLS